MKSERLYAITVFLMNHGRTSAKELASRFEVSVRTIQRDIDSLCAAGIPVVAFTGTTGGYELTERFTLCNHVVSQDDYTYILTALNGLSSATGDPKVSNISERIVSFLDKPDIGTILFQCCRKETADFCRRFSPQSPAKRPSSFPIQMPWVISGCIQWSP